MKLNQKALEQKAEFEAKGIHMPNYDVKAMITATKEHPIWVHFGAGNIFRGFIAQLQQQLLEKGLNRYGIIACDTFDFGIIEQIYQPFDNLTLFVGLKPDGSTKNEVIASVAEAIKADTTDDASFSRLKEIFSQPSLQMVSFTITEKGYAISNLKDELLPVVAKDLMEGPKHPQHAMSILTALVYERYLHKKMPLALVSMDNCSHNGEKLQAAIETIAREWIKQGFCEEGFLSYLNDDSRISFPWTMIDKITPRPAKVIEERLKSLGIEDMSPIVTSRNTFIAPFVNAEIPQYLVIEDKFPNGRPKLEEAGVYFGDRDTVNMTERMKVTTCLNPLHTALAVYGCLLGYHSIYEELSDKELKTLIERVGYQEGMPVVTDPKILNPMTFIHEVIDERLTNPFIPDTPQRIATDTSQKIPIRFGETLKAYANSKELDCSSLTYIPLCLAGWLRYLMGIDDDGKAMELSSDPMLSELKEQLSGITFGDSQSVKDKLNNILSNKKLFAVNLCEVGLAHKVTDMFCDMIQGPNAVRTTLKKYLD